MLSHLRMTSICKHLKGQYLHSTIPVDKNQNGLDTLELTSYLAKWLILRLCILVKLHRYLEETQLSRNASNIRVKKEINPVERH